VQGGGSYEERSHINFDVGRGERRGEVQNYHHRFIF